MCVFKVMVVVVLVAVMCHYKIAHDEAHVPRDEEEGREEYEKILPLPCFQYKVCHPPQEQDKCQQSDIKNPIVLLIKWHISLCL